MPTATPRCCGCYERARGCAITWDDGPNGKVSNVDFVEQLEEESKKPGVVARNDGDPRRIGFDEWLRRSQAGA